VLSVRPVDTQVGNLLANELPFLFLWILRGILGLPDLMVSLCALSLVQQVQVLWWGRQDLFFASASACSDLMKARYSPNFLQGFIINLYRLQAVKNLLEAKET